MCNIINSTIDN